MTEEFKRLKVDVEDIIRLGLYLSPNEVKNKLDESLNEVNNLLETIDRTFSSSSPTNLEGLLSNFDSVLNVISSFNSSIPEEILSIKKIFDFIQGGKINLTSLISSLSSLLPTGVKSLINETGNMISSLFGIVHFLKNFDPKSFAQNLISNLFTSIINKLPGNILKNISDNIFNGSSLSNIIGSVLGGGGVGNPVSAIVNAVFGRCASTASMKPINTLCGGFECPDAISLTEKHIRKKEEEENNGK